MYAPTITDIYPVYLTNDVLSITVDLAVTYNQKYPVVVYNYTTAIVHNTVSYILTGIHLHNVILRRSSM